jgi:anti-anti-sigma factor
MAACRVTIPVVGKSLSVIALDGELDIASVGAVDQAVKRCWAELPKRLHIDCKALTFIDSMGIRALMRALRWLQSEGIGVTFDMNQRVVTMLNRVGLDDQMHPIERDRTAAGR